MTARYRIHVPLDGYEGQKTRRTYTIPTRGALVTAPVGEFKTLKAGRPEDGGEYSREGGPGPDSSSSSSLDQHDT